MSAIRWDDSTMVRSPPAAGLREASKEELSSKGVERGERLIKQEQPRSLPQGERQRKPARVGRRRGSRQADRVEMFSTSRRARTDFPVPLRIEMGTDPDVLTRAHAPIEGDLLGEVSNNPTVHSSWRGVLRARPRLADVEAASPVSSRKQGRSCPRRSDPREPKFDLGDVDAAIVSCGDFPVRRLTDHAFRWRRFMRCPRRPTPWRATRTSDSMDSSSSPAKRASRHQCRHLAA